MEKQKLLDIARDSLNAFNTRNWDRFRELLAPNAVYDEVGTDRKVTGRDDIAKTVRGWSQAFPDMKGKLVHATPEDDRILCEVTYEGKHDGDLRLPSGTIGPSGRRVTTRAIEVFRIEDGLIVEMRNYFDMFHVLVAVNAIPAKVARSIGA